MEVAEKHRPGRYRPRRWLRALTAPAILLAITIGFFWKLVLTGQYTWLESPDMANQVLPWFQFQAGEWHRGHFPLWDPFPATGQSLIGQAQPGAAYPPNWILFSLPLNNGWIRQAYLHWYFVLTRFLAALFCYWLCRDLKRSRPAAIVAGTVFALGGYIGATDWPQMVNGAIWAPLVFLFMLRALRGRRATASAALAGVFLGVSWLSGHHQIPILLSVAVTAIWACHIFRRRRPDWHLARLAALFCLFAVLTAGLQALPAYEYGKLAKRWVDLPGPVGWNEPVPYNVHAKYSLDPFYVLGLVVPGVYRNGDPLIGVVAVGLAMAALGLAIRNPAVRLFAVVAIGGLLLALGAHSVFHGLLYATVPLVEKARTPQAAILIFHLAVAVLTAWGIDRLSSRRATRWLRRSGTVLVVAGLALFLLAAAVWVFKDHSKEDGVAFAALTCLLAAGLFWAGSRRQLPPPGMAVGCLMLILLELGFARAFWFPHGLDTDRSRYLRKMAQTADIAAFLKRNPWPVRVDLDDQEITFNFGDWYGIDVLGTYAASLPANFLAMEVNGERTQMLLGVAYDIRSKPRRPGQQLVFSGEGGLNVYQNPGAFPRVWTVHELLRLEKRELIGRYLADPNHDLARKTFVVGEPVPALEACSEGEQARLLRREPGFVRLEADMRCRGMVVLSDAFFPGWNATLDGRPARIYEVYGGLRGVVAPAGRHVIEMRYRPLSVILGGIMTALGVLGACLLSLRDRKRPPVLT
jgi:hypothetical protein